MNKIAKYVCFDVETTGLDSFKHNLLTVCFIILDKNLIEIDRLNLSIKYENYTIDTKALEVNKIDLIQHHNNSIDLTDANKILNTFLIKNKQKYNLIPTGQNIIFDINFIQRSGLLPTKQYEQFIGFNPIDTVSIAQFLKLSNKIPEYQSISLVNLTNYFGNVKNNKLEHTCEYDTEMTIALLKEFLKIIK